MTTPVLSVSNLTTEFVTPRGRLRAVDRVSLDLYPGETFAVVGESGSGKSISVLSILGLLPPKAEMVAGQVLLEGRDLATMSTEDVRRVRGHDIGMIFQDPVTSLNPVRTIGWQIREALTTHGVTGDAAGRRALELLNLVGIPSPERRLEQYPHEFSGGMCQRVMIAIALAHEPKVLVADEPTTALDVTVQAQILEVLRNARAATGSALLLITHDLGVVAENADRVAVMYAGRLVETGTVSEVFARPRHPYTAALLASSPRLGSRRRRLSVIPGQPPRLGDSTNACAFAPRCAVSKGREICRDQTPPLQDELTSIPGTGDGAGATRRAACHFSDEVVPTHLIPGPAIDEQSSAS